jgi:hypothetical protein
VSQPLPQLPKPEFVLIPIGRIGEREPVAIATSGLFGRIGVDVASSHVVEIPTIESATASSREQRP